MDSVKVTFELPAELVERAQSFGVDVTDARPLIDWIEAEIQQRLARQKMRNMMLPDLLDELDPAPEESVAEIRANQEELL